MNSSNYNVTPGHVERYTGNIIARVRAEDGDIQNEDSVIECLRGTVCERQLIAITKYAFKHGGLTRLETVSIGYLTLPKLVFEREYPESALKTMADEIKLKGWPKDNPLGVKPTKDGFEVRASYAWYKAGVLSGLTEIPCMIY